MTYSLQFEMEGLSFAARAVLATATALTYEFQDEDIAVRVIRSSLGLSEDAWEAAYAELYEAGHLFRTRADGIDVVQLNSLFEVLSQSMGPGGRPAPKDWAELRETVLRSHGSFCAYCSADDVPLAIDHIVPVSRGGSNHRHNLVPACRRCNSAKGNKTWEEWYPEMAKLRP